MNVFLNMVVSFGGVFETRQRITSAENPTIAVVTATAEGLAILRDMNRAYVPGAHSTERFKDENGANVSLRIEAFAGGSIHISAMSAGPDKDAFFRLRQQAGTRRDMSDAPARLHNDQGEASAPLTDYSPVTPEPAVEQAISAIFGPMRRRQEDWEAGTILEREA